MFQQTLTCAPMQHTSKSTIESILASERARLIRLCTRLTANPDVAEDLAQETLLEAWRNLHKFNQDEVTQPEDWSKWLSAIARNVCKRWARDHYQNAAHVALFATSFDDEYDDSLADLMPDTTNIEIDLERDELAHLLDRALALLPPSVREVLIERYINEASHTEISERLGLSEDALVQRLHRGKLALRRVISQQLSDEARTFGISIDNDDSTRLPTRIYCPMCGKGQLIKYYDAADNTTGFTCPRCWHIASIGLPEQWQGIKSPKSILDRQLSWLGEHYWRPINQQQALCIRCGRPAASGTYQLQDIPDDFIKEPGIYISCPHCGHIESNGLPHMTLDIPETRHFWRKHARMHWLPKREIEFAGRPSFVSSFQSLSNSSQLDVIIDQATFKVLSLSES